MRLLAGDIGGTNTRLTFVESADSDARTLAEKSYASANYPGLDQVVAAFLSEHNIDKPADAACFAVAGPVNAGVAKVTNLPWVVSETELSRRLHIPAVSLINDFVGIAYGIESLGDADLKTIHPGKNEDSKAMSRDAAIVGAGTGFGGSRRVWLNNRYFGLASEIGHAGFAPANAEQESLLNWMRKTHRHVSQEMLLSGRGLGSIYHFLREQGEPAETDKVKEDFQNSADPAEVITRHALAGSDELCQKTVELFVDIYGSTASNVALNYFPVGEVYIAGGIGQKIEKFLSSGRFMDAFLNKGVMSSNLEKITVRMILQEKVGLLGALSYASITTK